MEPRGILSLPPEIYNRISAGEVVEKPASIVKELVENSLDAGANKIVIEIEEGGIKRIAVTDNGCGIRVNDIKTAFLPHATSKIKSLDDLDSISTLGFRGEALASISSVSMCTLISRTQNEETGFRIQNFGGEFKDGFETASPIGTYIEVRDLFYNVPARAKFLRRPKLEENDITNLVERLMLAHPEVAFKYVVDGNEIYNTMHSDLKDIIYTIYGNEIYNNLIKIEAEDNGYKLEGYIVAPKCSKANRSYQTLFVNGRYVENYQISAGVLNAYEEYLMKGRFPIYILNLTAPVEKVDVNVHPSKKEVKFSEPSFVFIFVREAVAMALLKANHVGKVEEKDNQDKFFEENTINLDQTKLPKIDITEGSSYSQKDENKKEFEIYKPENKIEEEDDFPDFNSIKIKKENEKRNRGILYFDQTSDKQLLINQDFETTQEEKIEPTKIFDDSIKIIGTIFTTYIIVEKNNVMYMIDQHASHERQLYDRLRKNIVDNACQDLLVPYILNVNSLENNIITDLLPHLNKMGFTIEEFGNLSYKVESVPLALININLNNFFADILSSNGAWNKKNVDVIKEKLMQSACKHAIKAGDSLSINEIKSLLEEMASGVLLCPHGRPVVIEIQKKDVEKWFKRIV